MSSWPFLFGFLWIIGALSGYYSAQYGSGLIIVGFVLFLIVQVVMQVMISRERLDDQAQ